MQIKQVLLAPVPGPWGVQEYKDALKRAKGSINIAAGSEDFATLIGGGMGYRTKVLPFCMGDSGNKASSTSAHQSSPSDRKSTYDGGASSFSIE